MTELKPIRSEQDYEDALAEMRALWGAASQTPDGDKLEILATLVDAYEAEHFPITPPSQDEARKFRREQEASRSTGVATRFEIYKDKAGAYRFRIFANSEVLFTSDGYENKTLLLSVVHAIRTGAASSTIVDEAA